MGHPLELVVKPGNWRAFEARKADKAFLAFRDKVFKRDNHTCQFCGFQAQQYQEVINLDNDYTRNIIENMATSCCFCAQCLFLESAGTNDYGGGTVIFMPEVSQSELNAFCHVIFCAMSNATAYQNTAQSLYRSLRFRAQVVEEQFGPGTSKPSLFGQMILESQVLTDETRAELLKNLRLLPSHARFRKQIEAWAAAAIAEMPEGQ